VTIHSEFADFNALHILASIDKLDIATAYSLTSPGISKYELVEIFATYFVLERYSQLSITTIATWLGTLTPAVRGLQNLGSMSERVTSGQIRGN